MLAAVAASLLVLAAACGGSGDEAAEPATTTGEQLQVGLITDVGQLNDRGFNQLAYEGLKRAERELGVRVRVVQSASPADYIPNMASLARQGYDLVVAVGFAQADAVAKSAKRFRETRFAIVDYDQAALPGKPKNVVGLLFREQEVGYLAGYLAGLVEKRRPGPDVASTIGGIKEPPVDRFIAGYQAGAKKANPSIELLNGYSQSWEDQSKCKELALDHIQRGAGVVFQVAGGCGLGALDAARTRDVWGIGVDADQSFLGPHVLTSALKRVDSAVFQTIQSVEDGSWKGGRNLIFGLDQDGVGLGKVSPKVPKSDLEALEQVEERIARGQVRIPTTVG